MSLSKMQKKRNQIHCLNDLRVVLVRARLEDYTKNLQSKKKENDVTDKQEDKKSPKKEDPEVDTPRSPKPGATDKNSEMSTKIEFPFSDRNGNKMPYSRILTGLFPAQPQINGKKPEGHGLLKIKQEPLSESESDDDGDVEYEVETILAVRERKGLQEYLIKWFGFPKYASTWEPRKNLLGCPDKMVEFLRRQQDLEQIQERSSPQSHTVRVTRTSTQLKTLASKRIAGNRKLGGRVKKVSHR